MILDFSAVPDLPILGQCKSSTTTLSSKQGGALYELLLQVLAQLISISRPALGMTTGQERQNALAEILLAAHQAGKQSFKIVSLCLNDDEDPWQMRLSRVRLSRHQHVNIRRNAPCHKCRPALPTTRSSGAPAVWVAVSIGDNLRSCLQCTGFGLTTC